MAVGRFLFGTRRAALTTIVVIALILAYFNPQVIERAVSNFIVALLNATLPFAVPIFVLVGGMLGIAYGFKLLFKGFLGSSSSKKKKKK